MYYFTSIQCILPLPISCINPCICFAGSMLNDKCICHFFYVFGQFQFTNINVYVLPDPCWIIKMLIWRCFDAISYITTVSVLPILYYMINVSANAWCICPVSIYKYKCILRSIMSNECTNIPLFLFTILPLSISYINGSIYFVGSIQNEKSIF